MDVLVAVTAFAGALLAAITTGALIGRVRDEREGWLIAWTIVAAALCLSLGIIAIGYLAGFGTVIFRIYQVTGALLAPLWLAVGVIQLLAEKVPPRFAAWLVGAAFTIIATVIMISDPVVDAEKLDATLPRGDVHWDWVPEYLLTVVHVIALLALVTSLVIALLRWRGGDDLDADNMHALVALVPAGLAVMAVTRFPLPGVFAALLLGLAAGTIWYVVARPLAPYEDEEEEEPEPVEPGRRVAPARARDRSPSASPAMSPAEPPRMPPGAPSPVIPPSRTPSRSGLGDLVAEYRAGEQGEVDYAARMQPGAFGTAGQNAFGDPPAYGDQSVFGGPSTGSFSGLPGGFAGSSGMRPFDGAGGPPPAHAGMDQDLSMPATGSFFPGADFGGAFTPPHAAQGPDGGRPSPNIYGLLTVFTLMDGSGQAFDRLAEETVDAIRRTEPDTLIFVCHAVKSAPLQRIVYELYRDEVAYAEHQRQPHVERFASQRVAHVLAANVIELSVNAAKVVPLPTAYRV